MDASRDAQVLRRPVTKVAGRTRVRADDALAIERALSIRLDGRELAVTLRTPGADEELALGFLASEGVIVARAQVESFTLRAAACEDEADAIDVALAPGVVLDWTRLERHFTATAACGLCGRVHLDALRAGLEPLAPGAPIAAEALLAQPARVRDAQVTFTETGGLHAAVWCDASLTPRVLREDVGRHNAVDKLIGAALLGKISPAGKILVLSGRVGFELMQKAVVAGVEVVVAVGAPSSIAVNLAQAAGVTLIGFTRGARFNVYAHAGRVQPGDADRIPRPLAAEA
jgi:FdhD protein